METETQEPEIHAEPALASEHTFTPPTPDERIMTVSLATTTVATTVTRAEPIRQRPLLSEVQEVALGFAAHSIGHPDGGKFYLRSKFAQRRDLFAASFRLGKAFLCHCEAESAVTQKSVKSTMDRIAAGKDIAALLSALERSLPTEERASMHQKIRDALHNVWFGRRD